MCKNPWEAPKICEKGYMSAAGASFCTSCPSGAKCTNGIATFCLDGELPNADASACVVSSLYFDGAVLQTHTFLACIFYHTDTFFLSLRNVQ